MFICWGVYTIQMLEAWKIIIFLFVFEIKPLMLTKNAFIWLKKCSRMSNIITI